jgi:hypothetical protein
VRQHGATQQSHCRPGCDDRARSTGGHRRPLYEGASLPNSVTKDFPTLDSVRPFVRLWGQALFARLA